MSELDIIPADSLPSVADSQPLNLDAEGQRLRALAEKADMSGETTPEPEDVKPEAEKPEDSAKDNQQRAADAEQKTEATKSDSPEASAEPKSSYQARKSERDKAADDAKRLADNWKKFDAEKAAIRQEVAQLRAQFQQQQQTQAQAQAKAQGPRFSSQHLAQAVEEFEATGLKALNEGDTETAQKNFDLAKKARVAAQESYFAEQQEQYQGAYKQHEQAWRNTASQVIQAHPELADQNSDVAKKMQQLLQAEPIFGEIPNGFAKAYDYLQMHIAAEASGLKDEKIASLEKQLKELQERTGLSGSGPTPRSERNIADLSLEEQGQALRRQVAEADRLAYA
jgi:hypothetical protein